MSFFKSVKRAFGLGENYETEDIDSEYNESEEPQTNAPASVPAHDAAPSTDHHEDSTLSADIFDCVVQLFNSTQPEFVKNCLDTDSQKAFILEQLDSALKQRLDCAVELARKKGQNMWAQERSRLGKEVEELKKEKEALEQKRDESKTARLSAERQKRALIERVHDLETQLLTLSAEKEQYMLENRSMLNKLRVVSVTSGGSSDEILEQLDTLTKEKEELNSRVLAGDSEKELLHGIIEAHKPVFEMLAGKISALEASLTEKESRLRSISEDFEAFEDIKKAVENTEEIISKKDRRIASLKAAQEQDIKEISKLSRLNRDKDSKIMALREEIASLNATIAQNLADNAQLLESQQGKSRNKKQHRKKTDSKPRISAIDELLDGTDWLVSVPPPPPAPKDPDKEDDFGYKAPARKINLDEDKQLSLW